MLLRWFRSRREPFLFAIAARRARGKVERKQLRKFERWLPVAEKLVEDKLAGYARYIRELKPDLVLLTEDVVGFATPLLIREAHAAGLPAIIVPYTIADQSEVKESWLTNDRIGLFDQWNWFSVLWSWRWIARYRGKWMVRMQFPYMRALVAAGVSPTDPWMVNSGYADAIAVDSPRIVDYYRAHRFPKKQLALIGTVYHDGMIRRRERRDELYANLCAERGFDPGKPLLLVAAPPNQFRGRQAEEFADFEEMAKRLADIIHDRAATHNVLVSMHPNHRSQAPLFAEAGLEVHVGDMAELLPLARVFVAFASATLRWAIALGIPAINYDVYHYRYTEFDAAAGTIRIEWVRDFAEILGRLCNDPAWYAEVEAKQRAASAYWSMSDGRAGERFRELAERLIRERKPDARLREPDGSPRRLKALLLVQRAADTAEGRRVATALAGSAAIDTSFLFDHADTIAEEKVQSDVEACQALGIACYAADGTLFPRERPAVVPASGESL